MKTWIHAFFASLLLTLSVSSQAMTELDHVVVVVNDGVILQSDIDNSITNIQSQARQQGKQLPSREVLENQVTEKLIMDELQRQEAVRMGIEIDDAQLNQAIANIAAQNKKTVPQLRAAVEAQGQSYTAFRAKVKKEIMISEARNAQVRRRINVSSSEIDSLATMMAEQTNQQVQYKISHIQLDFAEDKDETRQEAEALFKRLQQGDDFSTMAYTYSKGPNALEGGDWGWMRKEEMPTIFADQISTQGKGALIGPFRSGVGYHILKIDDTRGLQNVAVTEAKVRHILIKPSVILSDNGAKQQLEGFIKQIKSGEKTFGELAQKYSQDPGSAVADGVLDYQTADSYVPEFRKQVESLPIGQISQPFKTQYGWHIVEVLDRREVDKTEDAMKNRAYQVLFKRKFNDEASAWLQELRAGAYIERRDQAQ
ncbi:MAG: peptidylprolyl isomerase SurA [Vibrio sp.]